MKRRMVDVVSTVLVAWPVYAVVIVLDKAAGRIISARRCRFANVTHLGDE